VRALIPISLILNFFLNFFMTIRDLIFSGNLHALDAALTADPSRANADISLPDNPATAHPLHRICDGVFSATYPEHIGVQMAKIFLKHGSKLNPRYPDGKDSPLTAACSLRCDEIALLYIDEGADIHHRGCHGGTALHWAAWCGRDIILKKLMSLNPEINKLCTDFKATPLFWAVHGHRFGGKENFHHQAECARILLEHGADPTIPNLEGTQPAQLLRDEDKELRGMFSQT
jgi:uncharacterized protein